MFSLQTIKTMVAKNIEETYFVQTYPKEAFRQEPGNSPIEAILHYSSGIINVAGNYSFQIDLGEQNIDLSIGVEMCIFMEQVVQIKDFLRESSPEPLLVDFFEQGCRIDIFLTKSDDYIDVFLDHKDLEFTVSERISLEVFKSSFVRFILSFINAVSVLDSSLLKEWAFEEWFSQLLL
jgi:hypothetical protein